MNLVKRTHYISGVTLSVFIGFHLFNQLCSLAGPDAHIGMMEAFRKVYRHPVIESILLAAVLFQVVTGIRLLFKKEKKSIAQKIQIWSGLYLSFFLIAHVTAVISGRLVEHLDTNFYYAAVGLNYAPATLYFIPYYFLAVAAISLHVASLHFLKTQSKPWAFAIGITGIVAAVLIIIGFTNGFQWRSVPAAYEQFIRQFFS